MTKINAVQLNGERSVSLDWWPVKSALFPFYTGGDGSHFHTKYMFMDNTQ